MMQPFFDYACNACYLNLKNRLPAAHNKSIRFCVKLGDRASTKINEFKKINWLPIHARVNQCALSCIHKFDANNAPGYMNKIFSHPSIADLTHCSYQKLNPPYRKTNQDLRALPYIGSSLWNKIGKSMTISGSLHAFKHNLKDYYFRKSNKKD